MKRLLALCLTLALLASCTAALAIEKTDYQWGDTLLSLTGVDDNPMIQPANMASDEYAVMLTFQVTEALWKDEALQKTLYAEAVLVDGNANVYQAQASASGSDNPLLLYFYCIPEDVKLDDLTLRIGEAKDDGAAAAAVEGPFEVTADETTYTLTPTDAETFRAQDDKTRVMTRLGTTVHNGGSQFLAGSSMMMGTMRSTKQYDMATVAFAYEGNDDTEAAADQLASIAGSCVLVQDGTEYKARVAWITPKMFCVFFACDPLPEGVPTVLYDGAQITIQP